MLNVEVNKEEVIVEASLIAAEGFQGESSVLP